MWGTLFLAKRLTFKQLAPAWLKRPDVKKNLIIPFEPLSHLIFSFRQQLALLLLYYPVSIGPSSVSPYSPLHARTFTSPFF